MAPIGSVPAQKPSTQKWVFTFVFEAPVYSGSRVATSDTERLNGRVDWTMAYDSSSDIFWPAFRLAQKPQSSMAKDNDVDLAEGRKHLLLWYVSNCGGERFELMKQLKALLPTGSVHVYGSCGEPSPCPDRQETSACYQTLFSKYKFYASFENSLCDGYITEKLARAFHGGMVPLVFGGLSRHDYERIAPADSFIYSEDFQSTRALAERLLRIDANDTEYNRFFAWRSQFELRDGKDDAFCELCQKLHNGDNSKSNHSDLVESWYSKCRTNSKLLQSR